MQQHSGEIANMHTSNIYSRAATGAAVVIEALAAGWIRMQLEEYKARRVNEEDPMDLVPHRYGQKPLEGESEAAEALRVLRGLGESVPKGIVCVVRDNSRLPASHHEFRDH